MNETSKCREMRLERGDFDRYLHGYGIDVCCGPDPLQGPDLKVDRWDQEQGDAQFLAGVEDGKYDFVYSSHGLEHMVSVRTALTNWVRVLKPGGWLYVVVPDYAYYEKWQWPSRFNGDHKYSFSLDITRDRVNRQNHYHISADLDPLLQEIGCGYNPDLLVPQLSALEVRDFDFNDGTKDQTLGKAICQICITRQKSALTSSRP